MLCCCCHFFILFAKRVSKKRDLSNESDGGEQQKNVKEGCLEENLDIAVFLQTVWIHRYVCNCLRNIEKNVSQAQAKEKEKIINDLH